MKTLPKKLNYLLVMPRLVRNVGDGYSFPLGIAYVSSCMKKAGYNVIPLNLNHCHGEISDILRREVERHDIDVVATGGLSFQYSTIMDVVEIIQEINPKLITIVGGGIITSDPESAMQALEFVDYGVIGEGEVTIRELCECLEGEGNLHEVDGIIYKAGDEFKRTSSRKEMTDIDLVPWPDYDGFGLETFFEASPSISGLNRKNTVFMIGSRSCPYNCTFCFHTTGKKYRQRSLDNFFEELDYMVAHYQIEYICLADELFSHDIQRVKAFCTRMRAYNIRWWAQFRVDYVTKALLAILKEGGCNVMSFGLESADNRVLKSMRKGTTVEQIEKTLKLVSDADMPFSGAFIFGDIEETWETANNTLTWWRDHSEYKINLNLITIYPGSYLYQYACENGVIEDKVQFLKDGCPQVNVSKLTPDEYSELVKRIMEAPMIHTKALSDIEIDEIDYDMGRIDVTAVCAECQGKNKWENVKLFAANFLPCKGCGQRYNMVLPAEIRATIDRNMRRILDEYGKAAVWGINYHATDLFRHSEVLRHPNVTPIDISQTKRMMSLYGKEICNTDAISAKDIEVVVVLIPVYYNEISSQIRANHKGVEKIIDICRLADPNYFESMSCL